jgi:hypothetical protein
MENLPLIRGQGCVTSWPACPKYAFSGSLFQPYDVSFRRRCGRLPSRIFPPCDPLHRLYGLAWLANGHHAADHQRPRAGGGLHHRLLRRDQSGVDFASVHQFSGRGAGGDLRGRVGRDYLHLHFAHRGHRLQEDGPAEGWGHATRLRNLRSRVRRPLWLVPRLDRRPGHPPPRQRGGSGDCFHQKPAGRQCLRLPRRSFASWRR